MVPRSRLLSDIPVSPHQQSPEAPTYAAEACADFPMGEDTGPSWSFKDCMDVWEEFSLSIPGSLRPRRPLADQWRGTAAELRTAKSPCLVAPAPTHDGVGSSTIRHIASWIYAEELGCDWVTPDWGKRPAAQGNGSVVYCHRTATAEEFKKPKSEDDMRSMNRCSIVNWLSYFQFDVPSVTLPDNERLKIIEVIYAPRLQPITELGRFRLVGDSLLVYAAYEYDKKGTRGPQKRVSTCVHDNAIARKIIMKSRRMYLPKLFLRRRDTSHVSCHASTHRGT